MRVERLGAHGEPDQAGDSGEEPDGEVRAAIQASK